MASDVSGVRPITINNNITAPILSIGDRAVKIAHEIGVHRFTQDQQTTGVLALFTCDFMRISSTFMPGVKAEISTALTPVFHGVNPEISTALTPSFWGWPQGPSKGHRHILDQAPAFRKWETSPYFRAIAKPGESQAKIEPLSLAAFAPLDLGST